MSRKPNIELFHKVPLTLQQEEGEVASEVYLAKIFKASIESTILKQVFLGRYWSLQIEQVDYPVSEFSVATFLPERVFTAV